MVLEIRPCLAEDIPHLQAWLAEPRTEPFFPTGDPPEIDDAGKRWIELAIEQGAGFTATLDGKPVGFGMLFLQTYEKLVHQAVHILIVGQDHRRQGVGFALLDNLEALGRDRGVELIHVEVYDDPGVEMFYANRGYREFARQLGWSKDSKQTPPQYRARVCLEKFI
jgi:GNAT superfamily N-acetyltransferase